MLLYLTAVIIFTHLTMKDDMAKKSEFLNSFKIKIIFDSTAQADRKMN